MNTLVAHKVAKDMVQPFPKDELTKDDDNAMNRTNNIFYKGRKVVPTLELRTKEKILKIIGN